MSIIKKFSEFKKTNEVFGFFSSPLGKTATKAGELGAVIGNKNAAFHTKTPGVEDDKLGLVIKSDLSGKSKSILKSWLNGKSPQEQEEWAKKYVKDEKERPPKKPIDETVEYIYKNKGEEKINWNEIYSPINSPENINKQSQDYYFYLTTLNNKKFRIEIIKHLDFKRRDVNEYSVILTEAGDSKTNYSKIKIRHRNNPATDYKPVTSGDKEKKSELNLSPKLAKSIFLEAERIFNMTNETAKKNAYK